MPGSTQAIPTRQREERSTVRFTVEFTVRFTLHWALSNSARIHCVDDLDTLLAVLATVPGRQGAAHAVDLLPAGAVDGGLQLGIGHPHRAFVLALDTVGGYAVEPDLEPWPEPIAFDCGPQVIDFKPAWTRVRPATALAAAREYVLTGNRPPWLSFNPNA